MADIGHLTDRTVEVWRNVRTPDGAGGWLVTTLYHHDLEVRLNPASLRERSFARTQVGDMQGAAVLTHIMYCDGYADVLRGDEIKDDEFSENYRVIGVQRPSKAETYTRVEVEQIQVEPTDPDGS